MSTIRQQLRQLVGGSVSAAGTHAEPRLATWLTPWLVGGIVLVASTPLADAYRARRTLVADQVTQQVALLSSVLTITADDLVNHDRTAELDEFLGAALESDDVFAAFVMDPSGGIVAGGAADLSCLPGGLPLRLPRHELRGSVECGARVHWSATPLQQGSGWLVVGMDDRVAKRAEESAFRRQLLLLAALALTSTFALTMVLRRFMTARADPDTA